MLFFFIASLLCSSVLAAGATNPSGGPFTGPTYNDYTLAKAIHSVGTSANAYQDMPTYKKLAECMKQSVVTADALPTTTIQEIKRNCFSNLTDFGHELTQKMPSSKATQDLSSADIDAAFTRHASETLQGLLESFRNESRISKESFNTLAQDLKDPRGMITSCLKRKGIQTQLSQTTVETARKNCPDEFLEFASVCTRALRENGAEKDPVTAGVQKLAAKLGEWSKKLTSDPEDPSVPAPAGGEGPVENEQLRELKKSVGRSRKKIVGPFSFVVFLAVAILALISLACWLIARATSAAVTHIVSAEDGGGGGPTILT